MYIHKELIVYSVYSYNHGIILILSRLIAINASVNPYSITFV